MKYLTNEQVLFIHSRVIQETGGSEEILDIGLLISAVTRPQASFDGEDLYPDLFSKAAALLESLARNLALIDGNKRTAAVSMGLFLKINNWQLQAGTSEFEFFVLDAAQGKYSLAEIAEWIKANEVPLQE